LTAVPLHNNFFVSFLAHAKKRTGTATPPAAGLGTRMAPAGKKAAASKQFFEIDGVPVIVHTLRVFARNPQVAQIVVALRKSEMEQFSRQLEKEKIAGKVIVVEGGEHRQQSVGNALAQLKAAPDDVVLVHDA